jgi:hypothetical protein
MCGNVTSNPQYHCHIPIKTFKKEKARLLLKELFFGDSFGYNTNKLWLVVPFGTTFSRNFRIASPEINHERYRGKQ